MPWRPTAGSGDQDRDQHLRRGQRAVQADQPRLVGERRACSSPRSRRGRRPPRRRAAGVRRASTGAEPAAGRSPRRGSAPRPGRRAPRARSATHVVDGAAAAVEVPEPRLAAEQRDARRAARGARRRRSGAPAGESTMPWSATTSSRVVGGQRLAQLLGLGVDHRRAAAATGVRGDAVPVAGPVEVAVVEVGQRRAVRARPATAAAIRSPTLSAPTYSAPRCAGDGQPGAGELALVDHGGVHAGARPAGANAVGCGCHSQRVDVACPRAAR